MRTQTRKQLEALRNENAVLYAGITELLVYVNSSKFRADHLVQISDIDMKLHEIQNAGYTAALQA